VKRKKKKKLNSFKMPVALVSWWFCQNHGKFCSFCRIMV